ncbi:zinc ribbon domain-containing protein [Macellibacteroides fermentans]|uniref:zinc ribbon domain-containing protein n=1 Tax=Macellibacteroides fermentans TaxID=879969 RepID=UPI00406C5350
MVNICSRCRSAIPLGSAFCLECGQMREMLHCTSCGEILQTNAKFCGKCGKKIE